MNKKGMAIIELLIGFLILSLLVACFLKASLFEEETLRIEQAKQEFSRVENQPTTENVTVDVEDEKPEAEPPKPIKQEAKDKSLIPQFLEILD